MPMRVRYHGLAYGHGLIGLDARSASDAERDDKDGSTGHVGTDIFHPTENADLGMGAGALRQPRR